MTPHPPPSTPPRPPERGRSSGHGRDDHPRSGIGGAPGHDDAALRAARRDRVFAAMDATGLDVLVLGRRDDVAYATGARALWTAGTRPFGAACVLVASRRATHLLSTWDEGVPPEVPVENLYGLTWNPATMAAALRAVPGLTGARRIGADAVSPGFTRAARRLAPEATLVPADDVVRAVRAVKLPGEVARIRAAMAVSAAAVDAAAGALAAGASIPAARAAAVRAAARRGVTIPSSGIVVERPARGIDADRAADQAPAGDGRPDVVWVDVGLLVDGYEGGCARTVEIGAGGAGDAPGSAGGDGALERLVTGCRAGATGRDLRGAAAGTTRWMVRGAGMGFEEPVVVDDLGADVVLRAGMVLSVEVEVGPWRRRALAVVERHGPATIL